MPCHVRRFDMKYFHLLLRAVLFNNFQRIDDGMVRSEQFVANFRCNASVFNHDISFSNRWPPYMRFYI